MRTNELTLLMVAGLLAMPGCPAKDESGDDGFETAADDGVDVGGGMTSSTGAAASTGDGGEGGGGTTSALDGTSGDDGHPPAPIKYDVGGVPDFPPGSICGAPLPVTCDGSSDDPWRALGLNCPGGPQVDGTINLTGPSQLHVHSGNVGTYVPAPYPPQEGSKIVILSSGNAADLLIAGGYASTDIGGFVPTPLPAPIVTSAVSPTEDCFDNPGLVGTGDCSNTIEAQWSQGSGSHDYAEMRIETEVPAGTYGFSYNLAMFSTEYPVYYQSSFNDMYIAWLESEQWTGNVSFDDFGHPISLNAGFLDYKDAPNPYDCPAPCQAPQLQGTAMQGHAGTRWLTTSAGVTPGEDITFVFGVFDLSDGILDTVVLLDNWRWECMGGPPVTIPG
jgi:hypothetical protein